MDDIEIEILRASVLAHENFARELSYILPIGHPRRVKIETERNAIVKQLEKINEENKNKKS